VSVFLARDREPATSRRSRKLFRMDGKSVARLKREFRFARRCASPEPREAVRPSRCAAEDGWFLTMEIHRGAVARVRPRYNGSNATTLAPGQLAMLERHTRREAGFVPRARVRRARAARAGMLIAMKDEQVLVTGRNAWCPWTSGWS